MINKVVVVSGGASGIGLSTVHRLLEHGTTVAVVDIEQERLAEVEKELSSYAGNVSYCALDVADEDAVARFFSTFHSKELWGLVNSAGIASSMTSLMESGVDEFRKVLDVNLVGTFLMCREFVKQCSRSGVEGGSIVNLASLSALRGTAGRAAYSSSKGGVVSLTKALAVELAPVGIRVNRISPGATLTPLAVSTHSIEFRERVKTAIPQGRYAAPHEIARAIAFMLSEDASFVTGQVLSVDGGQVASSGWHVRP